MEIDQRGGCCIARYAHSKVDRIMLRFRPIAPKPASTNGSVSSSSASPDSVKTGRGKRRQGVKDGGVTKRSSRRKTVADIKTLPLLPEEAAAKQRFPLWLSFENGGRGGDMNMVVAGLHDPPPPVGRRVVAASLVKVECVMDTCLVDFHPYGGIGRTDEEKVRSLDLDTCPGFVSDGLNRVRWMNQSYRRMVGGEEVAVLLVVEEGVALPPMGCTAFTCRVRVVTCGNEKASKTVPCDVWRMDCGGFAWRLDTAAALSLWIGN